MALSRFPRAMDDLTASMVRVGDLLRFVSASTGDLPLRVLDDVQSALRAAKVAAYAVQTEAAKAPAAAEAHMASVGGPATLQDFGATMADIETKAAAWNAEVSALLASLAATDLIEMAVVDQDGVQTKEIRRKQVIPAASADPFRQKPAVADLLAAFEAAGA